MKTVHPLLVRIAHWVNALAILAMVMSGWKIYNASPLFDFSFPSDLTLGGWLAGALQWHFAAMWLLVLNGLIYLAYGTLSGHLRRRMLPIAPRALAADMLNALRGRLAHDDLSVYNAAQRAAYLGAIVLAIGLVLSGLAIWKPVQLYWLAALMGDYEGARLIALLLHGRHRPVRAGPCADGDPRAQDLSHDDHGKAEKWIASSRTTEGPLLASVERRLFLKRGLSLGALSLLSGCDLTDKLTYDDSVQKMLTAMSRWNDGVQAWLFDPKRLAPEFPESRITSPFPFNAYYSEDEVRMVDATGYRSRSAAWCARKSHGACPSSTRCRRCRRLRGTSAWRAGARSASGAARASRISCSASAPTSSARYVGFKCADDYYTSIDMATALHPQTIMAFKYADQLLPPKYGFPWKLRIPTKLGFKNPKHVVALFVTNEYPGGYWEDKGYNWFSGS